MPFSFTKPSPAESQTSDISFDKINPIASQAVSIAIDIASSKGDVNRLDINASTNSRSLHPQVATQDKEPDALNDTILVPGGIDNHVRISRGFSTARHHVEEERAKERVCSLAAHSALGTQLLETLRAHIAIQGRATNENSMHKGLLNSLRTIRAQHVEVSRALRKESTSNASLSAHLQAECTARKSAEDALADLVLKNLALVEHNKLLISRDNDLQNDISILISKFAADNWRQLVLENKLRSVPSASTFGKDVTNILIRTPRSSVSTTSHIQEIPVDSLLGIQGLFGSIAKSHPTDLRAQLVAVQDKLHIAKCQLSVAEHRRDALSTKVVSLQGHISACVDECTAALEVERELRYEVEARVHQLLLVVMALKSQARLVEGGADRQWESMGTGKETGGYVRQMSGTAVASLERCEMLEKENLKQKDIIRELSEKLSTRESLETEAKKLKDDIDHYERLIIGLQMEERERTLDMRLKIRAFQRLSQKKAKRPILRAQIYNRHSPLSRGLARFIKLAIRQRYASVPMIKTLVEALPVMVVQHARRLSKALTEYSMAELNTIVNLSPCHSRDPQLRSVPLV